MTMQDNIIRLALILMVAVILSLLEDRISIIHDRRGGRGIFFCAAVIWAVAGMNLFRIKYEWGEMICGQVPFLENAESIVLNLLLVAVFLLVKGILRLFVSMKKKEGNPLGIAASHFYEYDEIYHECFLRKQWAGFRDLIRTFRICCIVLISILLAAAWDEKNIWNYFFPCTTLIIINEAWDFINGLLKEEYIHDVLGDEAVSRHVGNLSGIRRIYENLFSGSLLASHTGCEFLNRKGGGVLLEQMESSRDPVECMIATFFNTCHKKREFDIDCIQAVSNIMHGKSVLFFHPFYRDLEEYLTLPLIDTLLRGKKCMIITGRNSIADDFMVWLAELLEKYSQVNSLWKVEELCDGIPVCEVGILRFQQIYNVDVLKANKDFFRETGFVLLIEPSIMLPAGQTGISILTEEIRSCGNTPVYCICDRFIEGLPDTMSHLLRTEITEVVATSVPRCVYTGMAWDVNGDFFRYELFDRQTRFLGTGMELAAVAVKNQVPYVAWYGEKKAPLKDIKWIAGQYYPTLCRYMNLPVQQESLYEKIHFIPNLWCGSREKEQFIIVEDEFCNLFGMLRTFLSRGREQTFINVLSENYLLRDYMRCNQQMFLADPWTIPSFAPDYAKTVRNTVIRLIIRMAVSPVSEEEVARELKLAGCKAEDTFDVFTRLLQKYTLAGASVLEIRDVSDEMKHISRHKPVYYSIARGMFEKRFAFTLRTAYYIIEEEKQEDKFIDAKMFGQVAQTILPGQFVIYDGKYYEVRTISPETGVILRRASGLYLDRRYYRQIREYHFENYENEEIVYARKVMDLEIAMVYRNFQVFTRGYLDMNDNHDLRTAKVILFDGDPKAASYHRVYRNKSVLQIRFPDMDEKIRFTLCLLLSEIFQSLFPDAWQYLAVLAKPPEKVEGVLNYMVYAMSGIFDDASIYIVEDSDPDMGLLDAILRNIRRILEIAADFLDWHFEKMREPEQKDPVPPEIKKPEEAKKRVLFLRMAEQIRKLFGGRAEEKVDIRSIEEIEKSVEESVNGKEEPKKEESERAESGKEELQKDESGKKDSNTQSGQSAQNAAVIDIAKMRLEESLPDEEDEDAELSYVDGTDIFEDTDISEDNEWMEISFAASGILPATKTRYQRECYLKFGFEEIDSRLKLEETRDYLRFRGYCGNNLTKARKSALSGKKTDSLKSTNCCDFCMLPLNGISYEKLNDGRVRCNDCSSTAIETVGELKDIFYLVLEMMEILYGVNFHVPISVRMADADTIAKSNGNVFQPSSQYTARTLGYADQKNGKYSLVLENGSPRLAAVSTMVHELTHIWQYLNWDKKETAGMYRMEKGSCSKKAEDIVYEGMAVWASIQYLYQTGEVYYARRQEELYRNCGDEYGIGYQLYDERYPIVQDFSLMKYTPFQDQPVLDPLKVKQAVRGQCAEWECMC